MLVAQITDTHIVEPGRLHYGRVDTASMLSAAVDHLNAMDPLPDVVLATGDLVDGGRSAQYDQLAHLLSGLVMPVLAIPGNHDDRAGLRVALAVPTSAPDISGPGPIGAAAPIDYVVDDWPLRLIGLDTSVPDEHGGQVRPEQMAWLDETLGRQPDRPTLIFQHHPPFRTGIDWMDEFGLADAELEADVVSRHDQVTGIVCGHLHRVITAPFAGTVASTWPATGAQVALALDGTPHGYCDEPPAVALHQWNETGGLVSHLSFVDSSPRWVPPWAAAVAQ